MTVEEIADFCEFRDCRVSVGDPQTGFIHIDGTGLENQSYTWGRFRMLSEVASLPSPREVLEKADIFEIKRGDSCRTLTREAFQQELADFREKVGL